MEKEFDDRAIALQSIMAEGLEDDKRHEHLSHLKDWVRSEIAMYPEVYLKEFFIGTRNPNIMGYAFATLIKLIKLIQKHN